MNHDPVKDLRERAELMAALSTLHLTPASRERLASAELSVNAYPTAQGGGFVYVGAPPYEQPAEPELLGIFGVAEKAGVAWLNFDAGMPEVPGLALFDGSQLT